MSEPLALGPMHGWAIAARIHQASREALQVAQDDLYPALHRLEQQGLLRGGNGDADGRRLTPRRGE